MKSRGILWMDVPALLLVSLWAPIMWTLWGLAFMETFNGELFTATYFIPYVAYPLTSLWAGAAIINMPVYLVSRIIGEWRIFSGFTIVPAVLTAFMILFMWIISMPQSGDVISGPAPQDAWLISVYMLGFMALFSIPAWIRVAQARWERKWFR